MRFASLASGSSGNCLVAEAEGTVLLVDCGLALTETERRVAELAAQGLRNQEIADAVFISPKTVEAVLGRVYRKLGIRSRAEIARALDASPA